jgi:N-acetylglucosaminyldiphosphoundecaprenol N-acetyl-beta-D-mannosaminyltransferase
MNVPRGVILGMRVDATSYEAVADAVLRWAAAAESHYVSFATVNGIMEAWDSNEFRRTMEASDLVLPDGVPLVWGLRLLGVPDASRVYGPDATIELLNGASRAEIPIGFYGASGAVLQRLLAAVTHRFPRVRVAYAYSPPFRELTAAEDERVVAEIRRSGARILFVGLGTPKQERWMAAHRGRIPAVMLGVGAAFDFLAGVKPQAPRWMMRAGLEWLFRLATEPRRLWRRYLIQNPRFVVLFLMQLLGLKRFPAAP